MIDLLAPNNVLQLFREIGEMLRRSGDLNDLMQAVADKIGIQLQLDRCIIMQVCGSEGRHMSMRIVAEHTHDSKAKLGARDYQFNASSEFYSLLQIGKPLPLKDVVAFTDKKLNGHELDGFVSDCREQFMVAFPMMIQNRVLGCLWMGNGESAGPLSEQVLELGEGLVQILALYVDRAGIDDAQTYLTKQLSRERWARQLICKLHASLDRDTILQAVVDGCGRALGASRCLIVRTDGLTSPAVTHEYVEPEISPLGLGRTGQFPQAAISYFKNKVAAISDLSKLEESGEFSTIDCEYFADNGVRGMAGAPIISHGVTIGIIVVLDSNRMRKLVQNELDILEIVANQAAVALGHSQSYLQLKDQLFNMNLLGNLTQQLTNTLELVSRGSKSENSDDRFKQTTNATPLSVRELEVLKLIASGLANREIAQRLFLTESTVELHASRIRKKLKLKSRTALVKYACDNGLV